MIYGLYLSATGVLACSHRQDVIANNLANSETVGFKRDLVIQQHRLTEAARTHSRQTDPLLEPLGGATGVLPTYTDYSPGEVEDTGNPLDLAIQGQGFFAVQKNGRIMLTRDGRFMVGRNGALVTAGGAEVLDGRLRPIRTGSASPLSVSQDGTITQDGQSIGRIGVFEQPPRAMLRKTGASLIEYAGNAERLRPAASTIRSGALERSNADPIVELAAMMEAQRQLEANVNMIRYQDQTLGRLVNDVGRIG